MVGTLNQSEGGVCRGVHGGCVEGFMEGCMEVFQRGGGEKNQDFMLIRFLNAAI